MSATPSILTRLPRRDSMPDARALDRRIERILSLATPDDLYNGREWYLGHAVEVIEDIRLHWGVSPDTVAGMLAAVSSGYRWDLSVEAVQTLLDGSREGLAAPYGWRSIEQAEAIRDGADPVEVLTPKSGSAKRLNFFRNLTGCATSVTIDVHMARGLTGGVLEGTPSPKNYAILADAVRRAAKRHGERPADMQAILWTIIRGAAH